LRRRAISRIALVLCAAGLAAATAGCTNPIHAFEESSEAGWFSKPIDVFAKPNWATASVIDDKNAQLNPRGPVSSDELVSADGRCSAPTAPAAPPQAAAPSAPAAAPAPPADRPVGSMAGDLARAPMPAATPVSVSPEPDRPQQPGGPQIMGGIALGMSECDVVRRAGLPGNISISAGDRGERKVVLTYLAGTWPGIYTFDAGRLKVVDRAPVPETPVKPPAKTKKAKKPVKPKTATRDIERPYVQ